MGKQGVLRVYFHDDHALPLAQGLVCDSAPVAAKGADLPFMPGINGCADNAPLPDKGRSRTNFLPFCGIFRGKAGKDLLQPAAEKHQGQKADGRGSQDLPGQIKTQQGGKPACKAADAKEEKGADRREDLQCQAAYAGGKPADRRSKHSNSIYDTCSVQDDAGNDLAVQCYPKTKPCINPHPRLEKAPP